MGALYSKPVPPTRSSPVLDSVVLCDGLSPLASPQYAGSPNGRFIFVLGNQTPEPILCDDPYPDKAVSFQLDIIDLFVSRRTRIDHVGDFYNFGRTTGFYAIDDRRVVLMDYDRVTSTLRQRLIQIDLKAGTATCNFYRGYEIAGLSQPFLAGLWIYARTAVGEKYCVTTASSMDAESYCLAIRNHINPAGIICPKNPLSHDFEDNITDLIAKANAHIAECYEPGDQGAARVTTLRPPFFISTTKLGFFIDPLRINDICDPMNILEMDLESEDVHIREATAPRCISFSDERMRPFHAAWAAANHCEVAMAYRYERTTRCWQVALHYLIGYLLFKPVACVHNFLQDRGYWRLSRVVLLLILMVMSIRWHIMQTHPTRLALLNTKTLSWTAIKTNVQKWETIIPLGNGDVALASKTYTVGASRVIGERPSTWAKERFRLIRNPYRLSSLSRLSSIAARPNPGRVPKEILEQIAARMI